MLKEEDTLRGLLRMYKISPPNRRQVSEVITALIRAVREDCAKECDVMAAHYKMLRDKGKPEISKIDQDTLRMFAAESCAAAIRGKREGG